MCPVAGIVTSNVNVWLSFTYVYLPVPAVVQVSAVMTAYVYPFEVLSTGNVNVSVCELSFVQVLVSVPVVVVVGAVVTSQAPYE